MNNILIFFYHFLHLYSFSVSFHRGDNKHHRYSCLKGKTPLEVIEQSSSTPLTLGGNTKLPLIEEVPDGNIILIRFIRSDCMLDVFGEKFKVSKDLIYSYMKAIIVTEIRTLRVYLGDEFVCSFDYSIQL